MSNSRPVYEQPIYKIIIEVRDLSLDKAIPQFAAAIDAQIDCDNASDDFIKEKLQSNIHSSRADSMTRPYSVPASGPNSAERPAWTKQQPGYRSSTASAAPTDVRSVPARDSRTAATNLTLFLAVWAPNVAKQAYTRCACSRPKSPKGRTNKMAMSAR